MSAELVISDSVLWFIGLVLAAMVYGMALIAWHEHRESRSRGR